MKKVWIIVGGILLIAILTLLCFASKQDAIVKEILVNTKTAIGDKNITVGIQGSGYQTTRIITLQGSVANEKEKASIEALAKNVEGVDGVINLLTIKQAPKKSPIKLQKQSFTLTIKKDSNNRLTLNGYVHDKNMHQKLLTHAKTLFGDNIFDKTKEDEKAPSSWLHIAQLGLTILQNSRGTFSIKDHNVSFVGYAENEKIKEDIISKLTSQLPSSIKSFYTIKIAQKNSQISQTSPQQIMHNKNSETNTSQSIGCKMRMQALQAKAIYFDTDKAAIKPESKALLEQVVALLKACPNITLIIEGYTDAQGKSAYNQRLSQQRADSVKKYLIDNGIAQKRIKAIGHGEASPIANNKTEAGRSQNRRITLRFEGVIQ